MVQCAQPVLSAGHQNPEAVELQGTEILYPGIQLEITHSTTWVELTEHSFRLICTGIHANGKIIRIHF